jgi:arylsulfatase
LFKQFDHEGGVHTPMIAHWPTGIKNRGGIVQQVSHLIDVMPTVLDATETTVRGTIGGKERLSMDGTSLLPAMVGSPTTNRTLFFDHNKGRAVRRGNWKLVTAKKKTDPVAWELYDLARDPNELNNLAAEMPIKVEKLSQLWEEWSQRQKQRNKL